MIVHLSNKINIDVNLFYIKLISRFFHVILFFIYSQIAPIFHIVYHQGKKKSKPNISYPHIKVSVHIRRHLGILYWYWMKNVFGSIITVITSISHWKSVTLLVKLNINQIFKIFMLAFLDVTLSQKKIISKTLNHKLFNLLKKMNVAHNFME